MKPRRRPHPNTPAKLKEARRRARRIETTRSAIQTGEAVARAVRGGQPARRKPPRKNVRSLAGGLARAGRASAGGARRRRAA